MGFSHEVKDELTRVMPDRLCCSKAELAAFFLAGAKITKDNDIMSLQIETENAATARKIFSLIKQIYGFSSSVRMEKRKRFNKERIYIVNTPLIGEEESKALGEFLNIEGEGRVRGGVRRGLVSRNCCRRSFLRGVFLSRGFVSRPEEQYHLEISLNDSRLAADVQKIVSKLGVELKKTERKNSVVLYIKDSEKIADFLRIIEANKALLYFENVRIIKSMRNDVNRQVNCETANLAKTIDASVRQIELLKKLVKEKGVASLPPHLRELAFLRINYPDLSLKELGEMLNPPLTKSGVAYRMRKLEKMAEDLLNEL
ncbi:DNA-binding protein WhiA [Thermosyntropha sp.]|uniref:DNA-binding protein WhiA n=1 Tax=Thermosyntropha sp. TaxID=2740820 RepID=UPI0025D5B82E|nr:DNA-binding protein WhiA [Thermosyntropha sp.]MBO8159005.1 DNA-binding protein WhiA [Thermosyntropha sp.]